jgi:integrase
MTHFAEHVAKIESAIRQGVSVSVRVGERKIKVYTSGDARPRFTVVWYSGRERKRFETTDPDTAFQKAKKVVEAFAANEETSSYANINHERIKEFLQADTLLEGVNLIELAKFWRDHSQNQIISVADACEAFEASIVGRSPKHKKSVKGHLKKLREVFSGPIQKVTVAALDDYLLAMPHPKTRKNHRGTICSVFKFAQRKGFLPHGPTAADRTESPRTEPADPPTLSATDLEKMLTGCEDKKLRAFLAVGAFSGIRSAEIQRLRWRDIKDDCVVLGSDKTKTKRRRLAEVAENLKMWLKDLRGKDNDLITYPEEQYSYLYKSLAKLCQNQGVQWGHNCLRHTFVSAHLEVHKDPPRTCKTSGHSLDTLLTCYLKLIPLDQAKAWFEIKPKEDSEENKSNGKEAQHA